MHIQNFDILRTLAYSEPDIYRTLAYSELLVYSEVQKAGIFRTMVCILRALAHSEPETYSEPWHIQNQRHLPNPLNHLPQSILRK